MALGRRLSRRGKTRPSIRGIEPMLSWPGYGVVVRFWAVGKNTAMGLSLFGYHMHLSLQF